MMKRTNGNYIKMTPKEQALVTKHMYLVDIIVNKYYNAAAVCCEIEDLKQSCLLALCRAAISYNSSSGTLFKTYASTAIVHAYFDYYKTATNKKNNELLNDDRTSYFSKDGEEYNQLESVYKNNSGEPYLIDLYYENKELLQKIVATRREIAMNHSDEYVVFVMKTDKGYTYDEISQELGITKDVVRYRYKKVIELFKKACKKYA